MSLPSKEQIGSIILEFLHDGRLYNFDKIKSHVKSRSDMTAEDQKKKNRSGSQLKWIARIETVLTDLKRQGFIFMPKSDRYRITDAGKKKNATVEEQSEEAPSTHDLMSEKLQSIMQLVKGKGVTLSDKKGSDHKNHKRFLVILQSMEDGKCYRVKDFKAFLSAAGLKLNDNQMSGVTHTLKEKGYVSYETRDQYRISEAGKKFLAQNNS